MEYIQGKCVVTRFCWNESLIDPTSDNFPPFAAGVDNGAVEAAAARRGDERRAAAGDQRQGRRDHRRGRERAQDDAGGAEAAAHAVDPSPSARQNIQGIRQT